MYINNILNHAMILKDTIEVNFGSDNFYDQINETEPTLSFTMNSCFCSSVKII